MLCVYAVTYVAVLATGPGVTCAQNRGDGMLGVDFTGGRTAVRSMRERR